jgi:hypothetical protein
MRGHSEVTVFLHRLRPRCPVLSGVEGEATHRQVHLELGEVLVLS